MQQPNITPEEIKQLTATLTEENDLVLGELEAIYKAADGDSFWLVCHAYAYGFHRGHAAGREAAA